MTDDEIKLTIKEMLGRPLTQKLKDALMGIEGNIDHILEESEHCQDPTEYARLNGQIYAFSVCRGMLQSIIRLEEIRSNY
jgi:hypothetical protein